MKQIEVQIMGTSYVLGCPEGSEAELLSAVTLVDGAMCKIREAGKTRARERVAVLAALNLAVDLSQTQSQSQSSGAERIAVTSNPALENQASQTQPVQQPSNATMLHNHAEADAAAALNWAQAEAASAQMVMRIDQALAKSGKLL